MTNKWREITINQIKGGRMQLVNEIISVYDGDTRAGFIARRSNIIGWAMEIPNGWCVSKDLKEWTGNYATRSNAIEELKSEIIELKEQDNES